MDLDTVFEKTDKGRDEISTRRRKLSNRLRALLILVDGKKPVKELMKLHPGSAEVPVLLRDLRDRKYIRAPGEIAEAPDHTRDPVTTPVAAESKNASAIDISEARDLAVRLLREAMGPAASNFTGRLERCETGADLLAHAERYAIVIGTVRDPKLAETYVRQIKAALGSPA